VIGCVGLVEDVRAVPSRWRSGDVVLLAQALEPGELDAEAAFVSFLWQAAPQLSLAHDVGEGGLELALAEAGQWSGLSADVSLPDEPPGGAAVLACAPEVVSQLAWESVRQIGEVR
jgi:phosphoribosylformylglycinamidine (FGAM) synthase-like enzyme